MRDYDIRYTLHNDFLAHYKQDGESVVVDELSVCNGLSIIDVAVINCSLHAFEIKSDADTLARLPKQVEHYGKVFDFVTIVVNGKYVNRVANLIPDWWGIWLIYEQDKEARKTIIREAQRNFCIDGFSIAQLLWKDEALDLLAELGLAKGYKSKRRWILWERLAQEMPSAELSSHVRKYLKRRGSWKESRFNEED